ncbi:hypothetical protein L7F22_036556 [Adiantum nelumboides]|nr:hypothetical protein [Adiantum nelumboides]
MKDEATHEVRDDAAMVKGVSLCCDFRDLRLQKSQASVVRADRSLLSTIRDSMSRYDDRFGPTRLYVGHISSRTRTRDLEALFSKYGRVREVDMKQDFAFVNFSDSRDADEARHFLNGRNFDGSRIVVEFAKGGPQRGGGGGGGNIF